MHVSCCTFVLLLKPYPGQKPCKGKEKSIWVNPCLRRPFSIIKLKFSVLRGGAPWDFSLRELFSELRELLREYLGTFPELREWPFHSESVFLKVARLQSEFCTKDFFRATNFVTKNAPKFSPKFLSLCSVGQKKSRKIPSNFPTKFSKFPCEKSKKNSPTSFCRSGGRSFSWNWVVPRLLTGRLKLLSIQNLWLNLHSASCEDSVAGEHNVATGAVSLKAGKKKAYTALLQWGILLCPQKWGPQRKDFGGRYGFPGFHRVFVSTTSRESCLWGQKSSPNYFLSVVVVYALVFSAKARALWTHIMLGWCPLQTVNCAVSHFCTRGVSSSSVESALNIALADKMQERTVGWALERL